MKSLSLQKVPKWVSWVLVIACVLFPNVTYALPEGEKVVSGDAQFDKSQDNTLNVNQNTDKLIAEYNSFSIAQNEAVHFNQPSSSSVALNRVTGMDPSGIFGTLTANGKIFLVNPNGVLFGQGCKVDVTGMLASTMNISNADFLAGRYTFYGQGGAVTNQGYISAPGGYVALLGSSVENTGLIEATLGSVALASGNQVTLNLDPKGIISVAVDEATLTNADNKDAAVINKGKIQADGGKVILTAKTLDGVFKNAINNEGIIEAKSLNNVNGEVVLNANQRIDISGTIDATGGTIKSDSVGGDFSGTIKAKTATFDQHDGDTNIHNESLTGDHEWNDNGNIFVSGYLIVTNGGIKLLAGNNIRICHANIEANNLDGYAYIELHGDNVSIKNSTLTATSDKPEESSNFGKAEIDVIAKNNINISCHSTLLAQANGNSDKSEIYLASTDVGDVNVTSSNLYSYVEGDGHAAIYIDDDEGLDESGSIDFLGFNIENLIDTAPINGAININGSTLIASTNTTTPGKETSIIGMVANDINITNSYLTASDDNGVAAIGMLAMNDLNINNSTLSAESDYLAAVGLAALGIGESTGNLTVNGTITADGGDGVGIIGLLAMNDISTTGTIAASGNGDILSTIETLIGEETDYTVDLGLDETIGSAVVIGSINGDVTLGDVSGDLVGVAALGLSDDGKGNIYDAGTVSGKALLLLARHDIGTEFEPLYTDVDVVAGYSWDQGDIYLNEANDITLGLYLPSISVSNGDSSSSFDFGISLAAKDGDIHVVSGGDMLVNSVITGNGSIYLTSTEGSISTGYGWDPRVTQDMVDQTSSMGSSLADYLGLSVSADDISSALGQVLIEDPFYGLTIFGAVDNAQYVSPFMLGSPMKYGPNVLALGDSETPVEVLLDAQGGNVVVDDGSIMALNHGYNNALVNLIAERGDVLVEDGSEVLAATYNGDATVRMDALGYYGDDEGWLGGNINITGDSYVTAEVINEPQPELSISLDEVSSYSGNGNAKVDIFTNNYDGLGCVGISSETPHGTITVDNSTVKALVEGDGTAKVNLDYYAESEGYTSDLTYIGADIDVLNGSELSAEVKGNGDAEVNLSDHFDDLYNYNNGYTNYQNFYGGDVNIDSSSLWSKVGDTGNVFVNIGHNSWYWGYYLQNSGDVTINNSELSASLVNDLYNDDYYYYAGAVVNVSGRNVDISKSSLTATQSDAYGSGNARIWVNAFGQYDNESNITLDDVDISSIVAGYGEAYSYIFAYGDYNGNYLSNSGNLEVLGSTITASSGSDITSTAYHYADVNMYGYGNGTNSGSVVIDHSTVTTDVKGSGYSQISSWSENYNNNSQGTNSGDTLISNSTITATIQAPNSNNYSNYAYVSLGSEGSNNTSTNPQLLTIDNSAVTAHMIGDSDDYQYYGNYGAYVQLYSYGNGYNNCAVNINNSTINSIVDGGNRPSMFSIETGDVNILDSKLTAFQGGTSFGDGYILANKGSILDNSGSLLSANRLSMTATNDIGTQDSPINTQVDMLVANSSGSGSIYINEKDDLEVGINNYGYYYWYYSGHDVRANDGIISIVTGGDMLVNTINAPNGGVYLQTKEGSIYAGEPYGSDYNVTAGGASYFSALNGTIGVGYPGEDKDPAISGQIIGVVDPGVTAITGVNPSPDLDLRFGVPPGLVLFANTDGETTQDPQQIWPSGTAANQTLMNNPLRVDIELVDGATSALPEGFSTTAALTLQIGSLNNGVGDYLSQLAAPLIKGVDTYFELLRGIRMSFGPITPLQFYAYHPLTPADLSAFNGMDFSADAFDYIDGVNLKKK